MSCPSSSNVCPDVSFFISIRCLVVWRRECGVPPEQLGHVKGGLREWAGAANLGLQGEDIEAWKKKAGSTPV